MNSPEPAMISWDNTPTPYYLKEANEGYAVTNNRLEDNRYGFLSDFDMGNLAPSAPELSEPVKAALVFAFDYGKNAKSNPADAIEYAMIQSGFSIAQSAITTFFPLTISCDQAGRDNLVILENACRKAGLKLNAFHVGSWFIYAPNGVVSMMYVSTSSTSIGYTFRGVQSVVAYLQEALANATIIDHPPAVTRLSLTERMDITTSLKRLPEVSTDDIWHAFYPYFDFTPAELWDEFSSARANTIFVYGSPGLGKSTFIRAMMDRRGYNRLPFLVDDENILSHKGFVTLLNSLEYGSLLVSEDSDNLVRKREDGNSQMTGLLNVGEGISSGGLKMIISTNLKTLNDVDDALYRPGRTFRTLCFEQLTHAQANQAREAIGLPAVDFTTKDKLSLATALNWEASLSIARNKVGFGQ